MRTTTYLMGIILVIAVISCSQQSTLQSTEKSTEQIKKELAEEQRKQNEVIVDEYEGKTPKNEIIESAKNNYLEGFNAHQAGEFEKAIDLFSKCIDSYPEYYEAYYARGMSKYKSGNKADACNDWRQAVDMGSPNAGDMLRDYCN